MSLYDVVGYHKTDPNRKPMRWPNYGHRQAHQFVINRQGALPLLELVVEHAEICVCEPCQRGRGLKVRYEC